MASIVFFQPAGSSLNLSTVSLEAIFALSGVKFQRN